jgi:FkbM family methyltransferase
MSTPHTKETAPLDEVGRLFQRQQVDVFFFERIVQGIYEAILKPGDTAIDGGAHCGQHSFPLAQAVGKEGKVFCFEPIPTMAQDLCKQAKEWGLTQIKVFETALGDTAGKTTFNWITSYPGYSGTKLIPTNYPFIPTVEEIEVDITTLDSMPELVDGLRFIKLDIEGSEYATLNGAVNLLAQQRPSMVLEHGWRANEFYNYTPDDFFNFFARHNYALYDIFGRPYTSRDIKDRVPWCLFAAPPGSEDEHNVLAQIPAIIAKAYG